jgi:hypothetical protein
MPETLPLLGSRTGAEAFRMYVAAGALMAGHDRRWLIHARMLPLLGAGRPAADRLVDVGLFEPVGPDEWRVIDRPRHIRLMYLPAGPEQ